MKLAVFLTVILLGLSAAILAVGWRLQDAVRQAAAPPRDGTAANVPTARKPDLAVQATKGGTAPGTSAARDSTDIAMGAATVPARAQEHHPDSPPEAPLGVSSVAVDADSCMQMPVVGVRLDEILDTFDEARGDDPHHALDIMAPRWTPVVAAADGEVQKIWESIPGGHTVYLLGEEAKLRYYYAHLQAYRDGLEEGEDVDAGDTIGYVGDTGNAVPGNTHLHFAVLLVDGEKERWAGGTPVNPLPYLRCEVPLPE